MPKIFSARTGILASQCAVVYFWMILGATQEVLERLILDGGSILKGGQGLTTGLEKEILMELRMRLESITIPLYLVWYTALVVLGAATGLLINGSSLLDKQLKRAEYPVVEDKEDVENHPTTDQEKKEDFQDSLISFSGRQRMMLTLLVLVVFASQVLLYRWIVKTQSLTAYWAGRNTTISSRLMFVGLMVGTFMNLLAWWCVPRSSVRRDRKK